MQERQGLVQRGKIPPESCHTSFRKTQNLTVANRGQESEKENEGSRKELVSSAEAGGGGFIRGTRRCRDAGDAPLIRGGGDMGMPL